MTSLAFFAVLGLVLCVWHVHSQVQSIDRRIAILKADIERMEPKPTVNDLLKQQWKATGKK